MLQSELIKVIAFASSAICMGAGAIGSAIGIGMIGGRDIKGSSISPHQEGALLKTMLVAMAIASTTAMYALLVALLLLFVVGAV